MQHALGTHTIFNQTPPLTDYNLFSSDTALQEAVQREGAAWASTDLWQAGADLGTAALLDHARLANRFTPVLHNFNAQGERIDWIEFHPSWHALMRGIAARGYHSSPWTRGDSAKPGAHAARAAGYLMQAQIESGSLCPTTMTYGAIAAMRRDARLAQEWVPRLLTRDYDARDIPFEQKRGGLIGMGMTEKQEAPMCVPIPPAPFVQRMGLTELRGTNGSSRRRNATRTWCWRKPRWDCRASSCRGVCPTRRSTASIFSA